MIQTPETMKEVRSESADSFKLIPAVVMIFLMVMFVGATVYVLVSSLS